jgi:hypothetical protein
MAAATLLIVLRMYVFIDPFARHANFLDKVLNDVASIAIWNRNKVVTTAAISIWGIGVAFHINGWLFTLFFL